MSYPDIRSFIPPATLAALALVGCTAGDPLPPQPTPIPPSSAIVGRTSTETNTLWTFHGELLSPPLDGKGATVHKRAVLTCAVSDVVDEKGIPSKVFEACGIRGQEPPIIPLTRRDYCDQVNRGLVDMGQLNLKLNTGMINIFTTPTNMLSVLEPYSRCGEFTGSKAQAPHRPIYEGPVRGRASRRVAKMNRHI